MYRILFIHRIEHVPSLIQSKRLFIPYKAKMYIKNDDENENFRTKMEIAFEEIIEPVRSPKKHRSLYRFR